VDVLYLLIPLSVALILLIGVVLWLALAGGQFEDLESPALSVLADDDAPQQPSKPFDPSQQVEPRD
jgi:cbb3-type cytochrome oxidase maturation protein